MTTPAGVNDLRDALPALFLYDFPMPAVPAADEFEVRHIVYAPLNRP